MPRIRLRDFSKGLVLTPSDDETPPDALRRARNVAPLVGGRLRAASPYLPDPAGGIGSSTPRSLTIFAGRQHATGFLTPSERIFRNGPPWAALTLPAAYTGRLAVGLAATRSDFVPAQPTSDSAEEYLFVLNHNNVGDSLFKVDRTGATTRLGIAPLTGAQIAAIGSAKVAQNEKFINTVATDPIEDEADWTLVSDNGDAGTTKANSATIAISGTAVQINVAKDDVATMSRTLGATVDLTDFSGTNSPDEDFITLWVRITRPRNVENVEIAFGSTVAGDPFDTDFFSREITFRLVTRRKKKKLLALGDMVKDFDAQEFLEDNQGRLQDLSFIEEWGRQEMPVSKKTWSRITLPKASFEESGAPDWSLIRGIRITVDNTNKGASTVLVDRLTLNGGVGMIGDYRHTFTFRNSVTGTRSNPPIDADGNLLTVDIEDVERQALSITSMPAAGTFDPQADEIEVWRTLGNGAVFFRAKSIAAGTTSTTDDVADYAGLDSGAAATFLDPSVELPLDNDHANDAAFLFTGAAGPHYGRMFYGPDKGPNGNGTGKLHYSPIGRLEVVEGFLTITSGETDPVQRVLVWNARLFALTRSNLFEIVGTDEPFVAQQIDGAPGTTFRDTVVSTVAGLFWRSHDGIYRFDGQVATNITDETLLPIFRDQSAIEDFSADSLPDAAATGHNEIWWAGGTSDFTLIYDFATQAWRYKEPLASTATPHYDATNGQMLGIVSNTVNTLEPVPFSTTGTPHRFDVKTAAISVGQGVKGVLRHVFVELDNQGELDVEVDVFIDGVNVFNSGNTTALVGRQKLEFPIDKPGCRFQVRVNGGNINDGPVEVLAIELDIYVPECAELTA